MGRRHRIGRLSCVYDLDIGRKSVLPTHFPFVEGIDDLERVMRAKRLVAVRVNVQGELPTVHDGVRVVSIGPPEVALVQADGALFRVPIDSITKPYRGQKWPGVIGRVLEALSLTR